MEGSTLRLWAQSSPQSRVGIFSKRKRSEKQSTRGCYTASSHHSRQSPCVRFNMERAEVRASSTPYGGGGVGGKVRKPTSRKPPPTPYARPEQNQPQRRWLSKLVDPAYRLITGGATRLLPYLFSKSLPSNALPCPGDEDQGHLPPPIFSLKFPIYCDLSRVLEIAFEINIIFILSILSIWGN